MKYPKREKMPPSKIKFYICKIISFKFDTCHLINSLVVHEYVFKIFKTKLQVCTNLVRRNINVNIWDLFLCSFINECPATICLGLAICGRPCCRFQFVLLVKSPLLSFFSSTISLASSCSCLVFFF